MVVVFVHGLVFFLMGFAVLLQSRQRRYTSEVTLVHSLPWLGLFGVFEALAHWGTTFVPIQQAYLSATAVRMLSSLETLLVAVAASLLLQFGSTLAADSLRDRPALRRTLRSLAPGAFSVWFVLFMALRPWLASQDFTLWTGVGHVTASYGLAVPGAIITCWALVLQGREFRLLKMSHLVGHLRWLTVSFAIFAGTSILIVPQTPVWIADTLNRHAFLLWTGLPVDTVAGSAGLLMAIFGVRILEVFDIELGRRLETARRMKLLLDERDRIARELHDGIIQSLYGIGLSLEAATFSLAQDRAKTDAILRASMERLDGAIEDIRVYIMDLKGQAEHADLTELLRAIADELSEEYDVRVEFDPRPHDASHLSVEDRGHILQIVREAVSNSARHGQAQRVVIRVEQDRGLSVAIIDDGRGFDAQEARRKASMSGGLQRVHHGLRNMARRAEMLGGSLDIESEPGKGTCVIVTLPEHAAT